MPLQVIAVHHNSQVPSQNNFTKYPQKTDKHENIALHNAFVRFWPLIMLQEKLLQEQLLQEQMLQEHE